MKISRIVGMADYFYKVSVPLEEVVVSPYSRYRGKKSEEGVVESEEIGFNALPSEMEVRKFLSGTNHLWRLIYSRNVFGIGDIGEVSVKMARYMVEGVIKKIERKGELSEVDRMKIEEGRYLLREGFSEGAINVLVDVYDKGDYTNIEAVMHDVCHRIQVDIESMMYDVSNKIMREIGKDYDIYVNNNDGEGEKLSNVEGVLSSGILNPESLLGEMVMSSVIFFSIDRGRFISTMNKGRGELVDYLADFLPIYISNGNSLRGIEIRGVEIYIRSGNQMLLSVPVGVGYFRLVPRGEDVSNVSKVLREDFLIKVEKLISDKLDSYVGKVFSLFGGVLVG